MGHGQGERGGHGRHGAPDATDVLGVYEPIMHVLGGYARVTSRAAEPGVLSAEGQCYHADCYQRPVGEC